MIKKKEIPSKLIKDLLITLHSIKKGSLSLTTPEHTHYMFKGKEPGPNAQITLNTWYVIETLFTQGDIGFAESYINQHWESNDVAEFMSFVTHNVDTLEAYFHGHWYYQIYFRIKHLLRPNTLKGSKRNIVAHYDLGNDFYKLWLDKTMTYSAALFKNKKIPLEVAQQAKYKRIIEKLQPTPNDTILEIGCGWGGFATEAAKHGARITGLTLSNEQAKHIKTITSVANNNDKVNIITKDYRKISGVFNHIVSIEMFEAVGEKYWPDYFNTIARSLKKGGKAVIQTITIDDNVFNQYRKRSDFIQQYIFPGGVLPSHSRFIIEAKKAGLACKEAFTFGKDYATTLRHWLHNFDSQKDKIRELGFKEEFIRCWRFYLAYCIASFESNRTNVVQYELTHA